MIAWRAGNRVIRNMLDDATNGYAFATKSTTIALWHWPNILSLDTALIAVCWQALFAKVFAVEIGNHHALILGVSVWLAYVGDRWLDGRKIKPGKPCTQRHAFYLKYRRPALFVWCAALLWDVSYAIVTLTAYELAIGCLLLALCILYTVSAQCSLPRQSIPKEIKAGVLFAGGVFLFIADNTNLLRAPFMLSAVAFAGLCLANCCLISSWEKDVDACHGQTSIIHQWPWVSRYCRWFGVSAIFPAIIAALLLPSEHAALLLGAIVPASIAMVLIDKGRNHFSREDLRVCADFVLLSPVLVLFATNS